MSPIIKDLTVHKGATFIHVVDVVDDAGAAVTLTGAIGRMQIRDELDSDTILLTAECTVSGALGQITVRITDEDTSAITWERGVYDLELEEVGGDVHKVMYGNVFAHGEVTR